MVRRDLTLAKAFAQVTRHPLGATTVHQDPGAGGQSLAALVVVEQRGNDFRHACGCFGHAGRPARIHHRPCACARTNRRPLRGDGWGIIEPGEGHMACGVAGKGRLPDPADLQRAVERALEGGKRRG